MLFFVSYAASLEKIAEFIFFVPLTHRHFLLSTPHRRKTLNTHMGRGGKGGTLPSPWFPYLVPPPLSHMYVQNIVNKNAMNLGKISVRPFSPLPPLEF